MQRDHYLKVEDVADRLSCTSAHVYFLIREGLIEAIKIGERAVRVSEVSLHNFIEKNRIDPADYYDPDIEKKKGSPGQQKPVDRSVWMSKEPST
jgi:excisionase family DNA binding protein